jgi:membrane protein
MLSSSIAYYAVLGLAPLLMILLGLASLIGENIQDKILVQTANLAPEAAEVLKMILQNIKQRVDIGSLSGLVGLIVLLFLASFVFLQLRFSLDLIHGHHETHRPKSFMDILKERIWLMLVVIAMCSVFALSLMINPLFNFILGSRFESRAWHELMQICLNFLLLFILFTSLHFFTPTVKKCLRDCAKIAILTSGAFLIGNMLTGLYMRKIALDSFYGAAGGLLIFLLWAFYSALMIFMSVEIFEFLRLRKEKRGL